jgi:exopolysaccharide biosynthesis polyprenyl glycosylphosphotransferase
VSSIHPRSVAIFLVTATPGIFLASTDSLPAVDPRYILGIVALVVSAVAAGAAGTRIRAHMTKRILILGAGPTASMLIEEIESRRTHYVVVGVVDRARPTHGAVVSKWLGNFEQLSAIVDRVRPTHIVLASEHRRSDIPFETLLHSRVRGVLVEDALDFYEQLTGTVAIEALTPGQLVRSNGFRSSEMARASARALNVAAAAIGLVVLAPLLAMVAVAVKLDSRGPVFFVQCRAGLGGRPFSLLKFRTMRPCDQHLSEWEQDNKDRITPLGKWLRRLRLDELPQLVNVLRGEMNLIGPRPHPTCNTELFEKRIAFYSLRSAVLPGITGWAQVRQGYANTLEEETEKMRYDLYYIKNRTLWLDARIVLETIGLVVRARTTPSPRTVGARRLTSTPKIRSNANRIPWPAGQAPAHPR